MRPRPLSSTLFPYTTLFRSVPNFAYRAMHGRGRPDDGRIGGGYCTSKRNGLNLDRKSTRLNSSHTVISYAVFCLKKKIKITVIINHHLLHDDCSYLINFLMT